MKKKQSASLKICIWQVIHTFDILLLYEIMFVQILSLAAYFLFLFQILNPFYLMQPQLQMLHLLHFFRGGPAKVVKGTSAYPRVQLVAVQQDCRVRKTMNCLLADARFAYLMGINLLLPNRTMKFGHPSGVT